MILPYWVVFFIVMEKIGKSNDNLPIKIGNRAGSPVSEMCVQYYCLTFASLRSSLVRKNFSSSGTRIRQISAAVKPPL